MSVLALPIMDTPRLHLRAIQLEDTADVFDYAKRSNVGPNAGWRPHTSKEESKKFIKYAINKREFSQPGIYAIIHKKDKKMIGTIEIHSYKQFKAEIGFVLHPDYWGEGLIVEAAKAVIVYAFEILELKRLQYGHFLFNQRSRRVREKLGFEYEGILRSKYMNYTGEALDEAVSSITEDDYFSGKISWIDPFKASLHIDYE